MNVEIQIVSYNTRDLLHACLTSVATAVGSLDSKSCSVAVLDNASSDGSADMVEHQFPGVRLIRSPSNVLYGPGCNELVRTAGDDVDAFLLLNPDTYFVDEPVARLVNVLALNPDIDLVLPQVTNADGINQPVWQDFPTLHFELASLLRGTRLAARIRRFWNVDDVVAMYRSLPTSDVGAEVSFVWSTAVLLRRSAAICYGPFSADFPMYDADLDWSYRMNADGVRAVYLDDVRVVHVGGASSTPAAKAKLMRQARFKFYKQTRGTLAALIFRVLVELKRVARRGKA